MVKSPAYSQGGDAQAISHVAKAYYGSYRNMFEAHGWKVPGDKMMTSAPNLIVQDYGSIAKFEELHIPGELMSPMEAIYSDPPNVWLTSFYGFGPERGGFVGFADETRRRGFLERSRPGVLVVVYGSGKASRDELGKVLGLLQCSHQIGFAEQFMAPEEWIKRERNPEFRGKWNYAVKAERAWRFTPETRMNVRDFAPFATANEAWQHIGSRGEPLKREEAMNILKMDMQEIPVYRGRDIFDSAVGTGRQILAPSKAGPVSQQGHFAHEAEGPKHLYILKMEGEPDIFLGEPANGMVIVKPGFSKSPLSRCDAHNRAMPNSRADNPRFKWVIHRSGNDAGMELLPTSSHAKAGEKAMQMFILKNGGRSLGNEFFLAAPDVVETAWEIGNKVASEFRK